jgi:hypothetical protein
MGKITSESARYAQQKGEKVGIFRCRKPDYDDNDSFDDVTLTVAVGPDDAARTFAEYRFHRDDFPSSQTVEVTDEHDQRFRYEVITHHDPRFEAEKLIHCAACDTWSSLSLAGHVRSGQCDTNKQRQARRAATPETTGGTES